LAGAALGAGFCLGVDLLRPAVRRARENARDNGLAAAVQLVQGSTECLRGPFTVVVANLPWPVQVAMVAELDRLAAGTLILSGFRDIQEAELLVRYQERGLRLAHRLSRDEWAIEMPPDRSFTWVAWLLER
ncbi:MAG: 50S ribosomal protein L11 methyltransferase, partial [Desulfobaccales bacterium]